MKQQPDLKILYVSGEESIDQIRGRAHRMGIDGKGRIFLAAETLLENVFATIKELKPDLILMDSLQTFSSGMLESAPGSVSQVREVATRLMSLAKSSGVCVWLVGHVTKDGNIAGPKVVEHMVDTVLYFEAESGQSYRLLRAVKNRFGSSRELGVFEMEGEGLKEVTNPSLLFLAERKTPVAGTAVSASLEGSRPILVELQGLVTESGLSIPRRTSVGMDSARVSLIAAILEKHMQISLAQHDLFFNVAGGLKLSEPACDLAAAAAIWSSFANFAIPNGWLFIGELGLTGEVRRVSQPEARIEEAKKLGFKTVVVPKSSAERLGKIGGLDLVTIQRIDELPQIFR
jgi:DNA repair protein RadA/Sms